MKPKDMHKCDLFIEHEDVGQIMQSISLAQKLICEIDHSLFDKQRTAAVDALRELRRTVSRRHGELGNEINNIFDRWSNDKLA